MSDLVKIHNTNKTMQAEVFAADGTSIHVMPGAKIDVEKAYLWNLPPGVVEFRQKHTVFGAKDTKEVNLKKIAKENGVSVDTPRKTIESN